MGAPTPITITQVDTNPSPYDPQPFVVVGDLVATSADAVAAADVTGLDTAITAALKAYSGYSAEAVQTLKNDTGTLKWVTDE